MQPKSSESRLVGQRMLRAMRDADLSAEEVAERMGKVRQTIYKWTAGTSDPSSADMAAFATVVGQPVSYFYLGPGEVHHFTQLMVQVMQDVMAAVFDGEPVGDALARSLQPYADLSIQHRDRLNEMTDQLRRRRDGARRATDGGATHSRKPFQDAVMLRE